MVTGQREVSPSFVDHHPGAAAVEAPLRDFEKIACVTNPERPVVVIGAGPVGLTAALALRAHGHSPLVLEAEGEHRERPGSRAIFLHRESLEHLEAVSQGLGWELARAGLVWTTKKTYVGEDLVYERTYPPPDPTRLPHSTNLSQVAIEALLFDACKRADVEFAWGQDITRCESSPDRAVLHTAEGQEWPATYVIAADGGRSAVRAALGIELEGPRTEDAFVIVDVTEDPSQPRLAERVYYYDHPAVDGRNVLLVPFAGGIRADLQLRTDDDPDQFDDERGVRAWIAQVLSQKYAERIAWVSTYRFRQAVAARFTDEHHRVCLVGEAAHLFAPFGARGLNSGIPDALVAARAVSDALDGDRAAIERFALTRREAALYNRDASTAALEHMRANGWQVRLKRRVAAGLAKRGITAGAWLDAAPFGPRAAEYKSETGSY